MVPKFSSSVKAMDNKEVQIRGFIIPVDIVQDYYVLSANPYSSCFFCGQAGPESVMEVQMVKKYEGLRMDQVITFNGTLRLNVDDIMIFNIISYQCIELYYSFVNTSEFCDVIGPDY